MFTDDRGQLVYHHRRKTNWRRIRRVGLLLLAAWVLFWYGMTLWRIVVSSTG